MQQFYQVQALFIVCKCVWKCHIIIACVFLTHTFPEGPSKFPTVQVEVHVTWTGVTAGLELLVSSLTSLTCLDITLLDNYSWTSILNIGTVCTSLTKFHLQLWREDMTDVAALNLSAQWRLRPAFSNVQVYRG